MPRISSLVIAAVALVTVGCATSSHTTGRPIDQKKVDRIVKGKTTVDEVIEWFGSPTSNSEMGGNVLYTYAYSVTKGSGFSAGYFSEHQGKTQTDELTIKFDKASAKVKTFSIQRGIGK